MDLSTVISKRQEKKETVSSTHKLYGGGAHGSVCERAGVFLPRHLPGAPCYVLGSVQRRGEACSCGEVGDHWHGAAKSCHQEGSSHRRGNLCLFPSQGASPLTTATHGHSCYHYRHFPGEGESVPEETRPREDKITKTKVSSL